MGFNSGFKGLMHSAVQNNLQDDEISCFLIDCHSVVTTNEGNMGGYNRNIVLYKKLYFGEPSRLSVTPQKNCNQ